MRISVPVAFRRCLARLDQPICANEEEFHDGSDEINLGEFKADMKISLKWKPSKRFNNKRKIRFGNFVWNNDFKNFVCNTEPIFFWVAI